MGRKKFYDQNGKPMVTSRERVVGGRLFIREGQFVEDVLKENDWLFNVNPISGDEGRVVLEFETQEACNEWAGSRYISVTPGDCNQEIIYTYGRRSVLSPRNAKFLDVVYRINEGKPTAGPHLVSRNGDKTILLQTVPVLNVGTSHSRKEIYVELKDRKGTGTDR